MAEGYTDIVDEFQFLNKKDLERAKKEKETINKLEESLLGKDTDTMLATYKKAVSKRYFITPVGLAYLSRMRQYLSENTNEELPVIPVVPVRRGVSEELYEEAQNKLRDKEKKLEKQLLDKKKLVVIVIALLACVIGMIFIAATSDNMGYINTEEKILDKYSAWEEELTQREAAIREQEEQLK